MWLHVSAFNSEAYRYANINYDMPPGNYSLTVNMTFLPGITYFDRYILISELATHNWQGYLESVVGAILLVIISIAFTLGYREYKKKFTNNKKKD